MGLLYEKVLRPLLFRLDPERAHAYGRDLMKAAGMAGPLCRLVARRNQLRSSRAVTVFGVDFPNRIGLAAGMDKDAEFVAAAAACGFGHVEVGTVTPLKQPGNPQPRVFRYPEISAVVNRMGFNNAGMEAMRARLSALPPVGRRYCTIGVNIGKNKATPIEEAASDYEKCFLGLAGLADYFTVNVSSPNTEGLRDLQHGESLRRILQAVTAARRSNPQPGGRHVPVLLKIAPDLSFRDIDEILCAAYDFQLDGIVATNTTIARPSMVQGIQEVGGLSGRPLRQRSTDIIRYIARATAGQLPIIGVGGVDDPVSAGEKLDAGASLVQVYTGWIYRGPFLARDLARALRTREQDWV